VVTATAARHDKRLLFASSSEVYGKRNGPPLSEDADRVLGSPSTARWTYSTAKALGEMLAYGYFNERGAKSVVVRLFNTVGPRQSGSYGMVLPRFAQQALAGNDLTVYGDGTQTRCFSHVHDTVEAILCLVDAEVSAPQAFNIGMPQEISVAELAHRVIERAGSGSGIRFVPYEQAYSPGFEELGARVPDTSAIEELTGWKPRRSVDEAIDDVIAYERARGEPAPAMSENGHLVSGHPAALGRAVESRPV